MTAVPQRTEPIFFVKSTDVSSGQRRSVDLTDRVLSLTYEDTEKKADKLILSVDNWDLSNFDDPVWRKGVVLEAAWGYPGDLSPPREAVIQRVKGFQTLRIEAHARSVLMNKRVRCEVFENLRRSDVAKIIAERNGFREAARQHIDDTEEVLPFLTQARQTDAQFMKRLADREGFEFFVDFDGFHFHPRKLGQKPIRAFRWYTDPTVGEILGGISVDNDISARPGKVRVKGRDPIRKADIDQAGSHGETARDTLGEELEIVDPDTGTTRVEARNASEDVRPTPQASPGAVKREAEGRFRRAQQSNIELTVPATGDPRVLAKSVIELQGISKRLSGLYYVKQVTHTIDGSGYTMKLKCVRDGHSGAGQPGNGKGDQTPATNATTACKQVAPQIKAAIDAFLRLVPAESTIVAKTEQAQDALLQVIEAASETKAKIRGLPADKTQYDKLDKLASTLAVEAGQAGASHISRGAKGLAAATRRASRVCAAGQSGAKLNTNRAYDGDPGALEPIEVVDPETGRQVTTFRDRRGRTSRG